MAADLLCRLFLVFVTKIAQLNFLKSFPLSSSPSVEYTTDDDLDLGLYYLRTLSNLFRWAPDAFWGVLATRTIEEPDQTLAGISKLDTLRLIRS